jgi:hypothetical protein
MKNRTSKIIFGAILTLVIGVGCQNSPDKKQQKNQADTNTSEQKTKYLKSSSLLNCNTSIVSHDFSYGVLGFLVFEADTNKIKSLFGNPVVLRIEEKTGKEGGKYRLYNFTDGINKIILFKNDGGFYLDDVDISTDKLNLSKTPIGMQQDKFLDLLNVKRVNCDTIHITDEEATLEMLFIFKGGRLQHIKEINYFSEE